MLATLISLTLASAVAATPPNVPPEGLAPWGYVGNSEIYRVFEPRVVSRVISQGPGGWVALLEARPGLDTPIHAHDSVEMITGLSGIALVVVGNQNVVMGPGQTVEIPAGTPHGLYVPVSAGFDFVAIQAFAPVQPMALYQPGAPIPPALLPSALVTAEPAEQQLAEPAPTSQPEVADPLPVAPAEPTATPAAAPSQPTTPAEPVRRLPPTPAREEPVTEGFDEPEGVDEAVPDDLEEPRDLDGDVPTEDLTQPQPAVEPAAEPVEEPRRPRLVPARAQPTPAPFPAR